MSKKTVSVRIVSTTNCDKCSQVTDRLANAAKKTNVRLAMQVFDSSTHEAVELGVQYDLNDIPSFVLNEKPFCGTDFSDKDVEEEMRKA